MTTPRFRSTWQVIAPALLLVLTTAGVSCQTPARDGVSGPEDPAAVAASLMTGWFSSSAQAAAQPDDFFDIRLVMVPIWEHRRDGWWLYVEQASSSSLDRPYRQRVYHVYSIDERTVMSDVYMLPGDPLRFAGMWRAGAPKFTPEEIMIRDGCSIRLERKQPEGFYGSTEQKGCESTIRGATYATSAVALTPGKLTSWDRGFDDEDVQVWGATAGPYVFDLIAREPPE